MPEARSREEVVEKFYVEADLLNSSGIEANTLGAAAGTAGQL